MDTKSKFQFKKMAKKIRVKVVRQWRDFEKQDDACKYARGLLEAGILYIQINPTIKTLEEDDD